MLRWCRRPFSGWRIVQDMGIEHGAEWNTFPFSGWRVVQDISDRAVHAAVRTVEDHVP